MGKAGPPGRPSLPEGLAVVRPRLREPLFHPAAVERLVARAGRLPWDRLAILETRLASGDSPVDLSIRLPPAVQTGLLDPASAPGEAFSSVRSVWLEFDLERADGDLPEPVSCAKLAAEADPLWVADVLLVALHGGPLTGRQRGLWLACQRAIPAPGRLLYAFSLRARGSGAVRMEVFGLEAEGILACLRSIAPDTVPRAAEVAPLFAGVERLHLSFDLSPEGEVLPRIGIEGSFPRTSRREPRWAAFFDRLEERGLCEPGKRQAALAWTGSDSFWTAPGRWPVGAVGTRGFCFRALSHVKVVCRPDREPEAKVYLAFGYSGGARDAAGERGRASSEARRPALST